MNMKFTLIHPSRGRAQKAFDTYNFWLSKASGSHAIEHILSVDEDDPQLQSYINYFPKSTLFILNEGERKDVVVATNNAAQKSTGDILIYLSDDFKCPDNWDTEIARYIDVFMIQGPALIKVDDCLQDFKVAVLTIPIMNRELYNELGYFWFPEYKSMFVDEDLYWTTHNRQWLYTAPSLKFPHEHVSIGKAENDDTYIRSANNWDQGKELFNSRKLKGFPWR